MYKLDLDTLSEERLRKSVDEPIFEKAKIHYADGNVRILEMQDTYAICNVQDKHPYKVELRVSRSYLLMKCDCRYAYRGAICEHEVAACFAVQDALTQRLPPIWRSQINRVLDSAGDKPKNSITTKYLLFFSLQEVGTQYSNYWKIVPYQLSWGAVTREMREVNDHYGSDTFENLFDRFPGLIAHLKPPYQYLSPSGCLNSPSESVHIANMLLERSKSYSNYSASFPIDEILSLIAMTNASIFHGEHHNPLDKELVIYNHPGNLNVKLNRDRNGVRINSSLSVDGIIFNLDEFNIDQVEIIVPDPLWIIADHYLFRLHEKIQPGLLNAFLESPEIFIPHKDESYFLKKHYLSLAEQVELEGNIVKYEEVQGEPQPRLYLSESGDEIQGEMRFLYEDLEVPYDPKQTEESLIHRVDSWNLVRLKRSPAIEASYYDRITTNRFGLKRLAASSPPGLLGLRARVNPVDFLLYRIPLIIQEGIVVFGEENLKTARVNRNKPTISFSVASGIDWFDVKTIVNYGDLIVSLKDIRRAIRKKSKFIQLSDGSMGEIPDEWIEKYRHLFALGQETSDGIRLSRHHIGLIDQALADESISEIDQQYSEYKEKMLSFRGIQKVDLPNTFNGELRPYQKAGYDWLHFLHSYQFGGCLADDMGLGKTVQTLVFLQSMVEMNGSSVPVHTQTDLPVDDNFTSLIVVPRSLLINWQREAARFTPKLHFLEYFNPSRPKDLNVFKDYDSVITTYGVMLRDITHLRKFNFHYVILDESQAIKNPFSQTARAARLLQSRHRLVLTGTPVENTSTDLWSQFSFLNPGLLGNIEYFKSEFITPIEKNGDMNAAETLRKTVYPFILRRTKDQVAPELPPRTERTLFCDMEPAQQKMYNRTRDYYRGIILGMLDNDTWSNSPMKILEGLLRLRQICNHPKLVDQKFKGESAKLELILDTLQTLQAENHKALIFSQFVQMLKILKTSMEGIDIPYLYLDGRTRNRMELVDQFQKEKEIPFFLISLKAGGQGLNLTAADYVIHIDPWWNPAVEMQASDRTHRIGQEKPVFIYKLITRDTVEEKILQLQERKKKLVNQIITTESSFFKSLNAEDIQSLFSDSE